MRKLCISILVMLLLCVGCQKTPEQPLIVPKEQQVMVEKATATQEPEAEYVPPEAPERWTFSAENKNFTYTIDAEVYVPDSPLPMVWARAQGLSQAAVYRLFALLSQGETLYPPRQQTKADIEKLIQDDYALIEKGPGKHSDLTKEEYEEGLLDEIEYLKKAYQTAPETWEDHPTDGTYEVKTSFGENTTYLYVHGNNRAREITSAAYDKANFQSDFRYYRHLSDSRYGYTMINTKPMTEDDPMPEDLSWDKVMNQVQAVLDAAGEPFEIGPVFLIDDAQNGSVDDVVQEGQCHALCVDCRRVVKGVTVATNTSGISSSDNVYSIPWSMEYLRFIVDSDGILTIEWNNPLTILDTVSETVNLMSFEDIRTTAERMLPIVYSPAGWEHYRSMEITISHVRLELMRVREQNNTNELKGLLVPAWVFYGTAVGTDREDFQDYSSYGLRGGTDFYRGDEILLCLNAVDGSVIDPLLGY